MIRHATYSSQFGVLVPRSSGFEFTVQCNGMLCEQRHLEGIYLPLPTAHKITEDHGLVNLISELRIWNYELGSSKLTLDWSNIDDIWDAIKEAMDFEWSDGDPPEGYQPNVEAIRWIRIDGPKWRPDSISGERREMRYFGDWDKKLEDEVVALIYPNCD